MERVRSEHTYAAGQVLFHQGTPCLGLHCLGDGMIALRRTEANGNAVLLRLVHPGEPLALEDFFAGGPYTATAEALSEVRVCFVDQASLGRVLDEHPSLVRAYLHRIAFELRRSERLRLHAWTHPVRVRLAALLVDFKDRFGAVDDGGYLTIQLPVSRQDLAALVGARIETISRNIRALESDGVAVFRGRAVRIADLDRLLDELEQVD